VRSVAPMPCYQTAGGGSYWAHGRSPRSEFFSEPFDGLSVSGGACVRDTEK
jgi:hypothetical protein